MDVGSFVIDADSVRWALDLAAENYTRIEALGLDLWNKEQNSDRWKIFRYNNYSHSTLVVNDQYQRVSAYAPITEYVGEGEFSQAVIDMTEIYAGQLAKAIRGASLLPSGQIIIWDQLQATEQAATIRWAMTTAAGVNITSDTTAILSQEQKEMQFHVVTDSDIELTTFSTEPPASYDSANPDTRQIGFKVELESNESTRMAVFLIPGAQNDPVNAEFLQSDLWKLDSN